MREAGRPFRRRARAKVAVTKTQTCRTRSTRGVKSPQRTRCANFDKYYPNWVVAGQKKDGKVRVGGPRVGKGKSRRRRRPAWHARARASLSLSLSLSFLPLLPSRISVHLRLARPRHRDQMRVVPKKQYYIQQDSTNIVKLPSPTKAGTAAVQRRAFKMSRFSMFMRRRPRCSTGGQSPHIPYQGHHSRRTATGALAARG